MSHDNRAISTNDITTKRYRLYYLRLLNLHTLLYKFSYDKSKFSLWVSAAHNIEQQWTNLYLTLQC